jgi:hypothetical protein
MAIAINDIDLSSLTYQESRQSGGPTQNIFVNASGREAFKFSMSANQIDLASEEVVRGLPTISRVDPPLSAGQKHTIVVNLPDERIVSKFSEIDQHNIHVLGGNATTFFKKALHTKDVAQMYKPILRPQTEQYPASLRAKLVFDNADDRRNTHIFVADGFATMDRPLSYVPGTMADLEQGAFVLMIVQCGVMWTRDRECGMSFNATEIFVWKDRSVASTGLAAFSWASETPKEVE